MSLRRLMELAHKHELSGMFDTNTVPEGQE